MRPSSRISRHFRGIIDTTLREGFQFRGADFTTRNLRDIHLHLARIGVDYIEVGNPASGSVRKMIAGMLTERRAGFPRVLAHIRNHGGDLKAALGCGVEGVNFLCSVDPERLAGMGLTEAQYLGRLRRNLKRAADAGLETRVGIEAFFNQNPRRSRNILGLAEEAGANRICLSDTLGRAQGWEVAERVLEARSRCRVEFEVHFHNDLGHAVSNALTAVAAGANWVDTALLGIGERTGITPLSSFLINLHLIDPSLTERYRLSRLTRAECDVSKACRIEMPIHLPTNPFNGFAHKAGIHLDAMLKHGPKTYEALPPGIIGNRRTLVTGSIISGKTSREDVRNFERRHAAADREDAGQDEEREPC